MNNLNRTKTSAACFFAVRFLLAFAASAVATVHYVDINSPTLRRLTPIGSPPPQTSRAVLFRTDNTPNPSGSSSAHQAKTAFAPAKRLNSLL